jgi:DNA processing protein
MRRWRLSGRLLWWWCTQRFGWRGQDRARFRRGLGRGRLRGRLGLDARHRRGCAPEALAGATIGVIASGIDETYPSEHAKLQQEIAPRGLQIAEHPTGTEPLARHVPSRNRIIAGLASGSLVVEAAPNSGSLITARLAVVFGREVMAIPGSPLDSRAHGCNQLIRDGAVLVQTTEDFIELLSGFDGKPTLDLLRGGAHLCVG